MSENVLTLTPIEARILGVLVEKEKTTPDVYPLTLNGLVSGCNQKTSRDPVMQLSEPEIIRALESLRQKGLVGDSYGTSGRVLRYSHSFAKVFRVPSAAVALLATLMLRGPQTVSELRANCDRLHYFADSSSVEGYLEELAARGDEALALRLPKQPGSREPRWAHLLCGEVQPGSVREPVSAGAAGSDLEARVDALEVEVAELKEIIVKLLASRQ